MQIFANGKRHFYPFMGFYMIHLRNEQHEQATVWIWHTRGKGLTFAFWISDRDCKGASVDDDEMTPKISL